MAIRRDTGEPAGYSSYLLRLWRYEREGGVAWRVSLTGTDRGQEVVLVGFDELVAYLRGDLGLPAARSKEQR